MYRIRFGGWATRKKVRSIKDTIGRMAHHVFKMTSDSNFNSANSNFNQKNLPFLSSTGFGNRQSPENDSAGAVSHRLWVQVRGMFPDRGWPKDPNRQQAIAALSIEHFLNSLVTVASLVGTGSAATNGRRARGPSANERAAW